MDSRSATLNFDGISQYCSCLSLTGQKEADIQLLLDVSFLCQWITQFRKWLEAEVNLTGFNRINESSSLNNSLDYSFWQIMIEHSYRHCKDQQQMDLHKEPSNAALRHSSHSEITFLENFHLESSSFQEFRCLCMGISKC